jgi:hypothetical protein
MQILKVSTADISKGKATDQLFDGFRGVMRGGAAPYPVRDGLVVYVKPWIDGEYMVELVAENGTVIASAICDQFDE